MQPATESADVFSLAATLCALLGGSLVPVHSAISKSHGVTVTVITNSQQLLSRWRPPRHNNGEETPRSHSRPGRGLGYCDRTRDGWADQRHDVGDAGV
jgi:hypothetical protein